MRLQGKLAEESPKEDTDNQCTEVEREVACLRRAHEVSQLVDEPDGEGEEPFDDIIVECARHAGDAAENELPEAVHTMIAALFDYDGYTSVFDLEAYPQYQIFNRETQTIAPLTSDAPVSVAPKYSFFKKLIELLKLLFGLLKK